MRLPPEIKSIILDYLSEFYIVMSLPKLRSIHRMVHLSNTDIIQRFYIRKVVSSGGLVCQMNIGCCLEQFLSNPVDLYMLSESVGGSLKHCMHTAALKWVILDQRLYDYHQFRNAFLESYMFRVFNRLEF